MCVYRVCVTVCRYNTEPRPLHFQHMLSVMSAFKILKPDVIYFHTNIPPIGPYWQRVLRLPSLKVRVRPEPADSLIILCVL